MNYLDLLCDDLYELLLSEYLNNEDLYKLANAYKIRGTKNIKRLIEYCDPEGEDWQYMIDCDNFENVKLLLLTKRIRLKYFSDEIKKNKKLVLEFIKEDPYNLRYAHVKFLDDKDIIILVVQRYDYVVKDISERLTDDDDIMNIAIKNNKFNIIFASERIKAKYADLLQEVNTYSRMTWHGIILKKDYYLNEELTDNKYVEMRKLYYDNIEREKKELLQLKLQLKKEREHIQNLDNEYRKRHGLSEYTRIYRNEFMQVISQQDYLDDYYNNHHYYIDGYDS